ncbi:hypothetical protein [Coprobacter sp.]
MRIKNLIYSSVLLLGICFSGCKDDNGEVFVSMNRTEKTMYKGETYQFNVSIQTADNVVYTESLTWTIEKNAPNTALNVAEDADVVSIDESGKVTALNYGEATIKATTASGRFVYARITVDQRAAPSADGLMFTESDHYMAAVVGGDSLVIVIDTTRVTYCPVDDLINELQITSEDESLLKLTLQPATVKVTDEETGITTTKIVRNRFWAILDVVEKNRDATVLVTASLGGTSISCNVHIGVNLYLSLAPYISDGVGKPTVLEEMSYKISINNKTINPNNDPDTIRVYFRATPEGRVDEIMGNLKLTTSGESTLFVTGHRLADDYVSSREYWIFVETGPNSGNTDIKLSSEEAGVSVTAKCEVFNKYDHPIESLKFKEGEDGWNESVEYTTQSVSNALMELLEAGPFGITDYWPVEWAIASGNATLEYLYSKDESTGKQALTDVLMNAAAPGKVVVTASVGDDRIGKKTAQAIFTVLLKVDNVGVSLAKDRFALHEVGKAGIDAASNFTVPVSAIQWRSTDESVIVINDAGEFEAVGVGSANIIVSVTDDLGNVLNAEKKITVTDDSNIHDLNFDAEPYLYFEDANGYIMVFPSANDEISYRIKVESLLGNNGTHDITGRDIVYVVYDETASIVSGTVTVNGDKLVFNDVKAQKGSKIVTISGTINYDK